MTRDELFEKYKINPNINKGRGEVKSQDPYFDELQGLADKVNKLVTLEMVKSENIRVKRGLLNTIILECERIKGEYLELEEGEQHYERFNK